MYCTIPIPNKFQAAAIHGSGPPKSTHRGLGYKWSSSYHDDSLSDDEDNDDYGDDIDAVIYRKAAHYTCSSFMYAPSSNSLYNVMCMVTLICIALYLDHY
jgi:hypothetical protein